MGSNWVYFDYFPSMEMRYKKDNVKMQLKQTILTISLFLVCTHALAQRKPSDWSRTEYHIQNRFIHEGMGVQKFNTTIDFGLGLSTKLGLTRTLALNLGLTANYGNFKSNSDGMLYVSSFKRTRIHYYTHNSVTQMTLEIPVGIHINLYKNIKNSIDFTLDVLPQFGLYAVHKGTQWNENLTIRETLLSPNEPFFQSTILSDTYLRAGFSYSLFLNKLSIGSGIEYSIFGESVGFYTKLGLSH